MNYTSIKNNDSSYGEGVRVSLFVSDYGERFDSSVADKIIEMVSEPTISGLSILGYDPLRHSTNDLILLSMLCNRVRRKGKTVWLWTGFTWEDILSLPCRDIQHQYQKFLVADCNVVVDGAQRVIDVQASLRDNSVITYQGSDTMSAVTKGYVYQVKIDKDSKKPEPTISLETLKKYQADVAKYL